MTERCWLRTRQAWKAMHHRCYHQNDASYKYYGARGITVDPEWRDFDVFLHDMGEVPAGMSLERRHVDLGYSFENCRWATAAEQARNKTNTRWIVFAGEKLSITTWAERLGLHVTTLKFRIARWGLEAALTTPSLASPNCWRGPRRSSYDLPKL